MIENGVNPEALAVSFIFLFLQTFHFKYLAAGVSGMNHWTSEDKNKFL